MTKKQNGNDGSNGAVNHNNGTSWSEDLELMERLRGVVEGEIAIAERGAYPDEEHDGDGLEVSSDGDLYRMESALRKSITRCSSARERRPLEIDLCYVQREIDIRRRRAEVAAVLRESEEEGDGDDA